MQDLMGFEFQNKHGKNSLFMFGDHTPLHGRKGRQPETTRPWMSDKGNQPGARRTGLVLDGSRASVCMYMYVYAYIHTFAQFYSSECHDSVEQRTKAWKSILIYKMMGN